MKLKDLLKNVQDVELTPEQEKQIKDYLGIKESKKFVPNYGDIYYYIPSDGYILETVYCKNHTPDRFRLVMGNCFKTKEEAEFTLEKIMVYQELKQFADENNGRPIEWNKLNVENYYIYLSHDDNILLVSDRWSCQDLGQIYFSSEELAKQAIAKVGEDRIKKYLFGVE